VPVHATVRALSDASTPGGDEGRDGGGNDDGEDDDCGVPPDVAVRLLRALDRSPSTVVTLVDADLTTRWMSRSAARVTGFDPDARAGRKSLERIHPDDGARLLHGLAQLRAASRDGTADQVVIEPLRYRKQRADGSWVTVEALVQNLLDDPVVNGLVFITRPVGSELDGVDRVVDLLVADAPLPEVLTACSRLVPDYLGAAAVVALTEGAPVIGAVAGGPAARLAGDDRWWRAAVARGEMCAPADLDGFPPDLAARARAEGFRSAWVMPLPDTSTGEVMGCVVVWVSAGIEHSIGTDQGLRQTIRLATLVIGEERRHHSLERAAVTDPLTGVGNRSALRMRLEAARPPVTVAVVDLDDFKPINDSYGHDAGDAVLRVVAQRLVGAVREDDRVVRLGGDEFAVVFADGTSAEGVARATERFLAAIRAPIRCERGPTVEVGASVGVATGAGDEVMRLADGALYEAKRSKGLISMRNVGGARSSRPSP
jgi:diguanylate cyclase (GGDEF)-like protein